MELAAATAKTRIIARTTPIAVIATQRGTFLMAAS
jgi:hypothetical protein